MNKEEQLKKQKKLVDLISELAVEGKGTPPKILINLGREDVDLLFTPSFVNKENVITNEIRDKLDADGGVK